MGDTTTNTPILRTKLHRPPMPPDLLPRARLLERLEHGLWRPLTLVSASAGYGKSTVLSHWLEVCDRAGAWVSLDEGDNDLRLFSSYFLAAVQTLFPAACRQTQALLGAANLPPPSVLATSLINELDSVEQKFVPVLDDVHLIRDPSVHDLLAHLLRHPPAPMHLVLAGRRDPALPVSGLRARDQVNEIRVQDLRFSIAETVAFLRHVLAIDVDEETATLVEEGTEGWVTALRLVALSARHRGSIDRLAADLRANPEYVREYLFDEVLSAQPPAARDHLLETSILDRFCAPLCDALRDQDSEPGPGPTDSWSLIARLQKENLFVVSLDAENRWFRFHHLFQELLRKQLRRDRSSEEIAALHSRAGAWFVENGLIEEALQHMIAADEISLAVELVAQHRHRLMAEGQWRRLERILGLFADPVAATRPELLLMKAWMSYHYSQWRQMGAALDRCERLIAAPASETEVAGYLLGEIGILRSRQFYFEADGQRTLSYIERAEDQIPPEYVYLHGHTTIMASLAHQMIGDPAGALKIAKQQAYDETSFQNLRRYALCSIHWMEGDLTALQQTATQYLAAVVEPSTPHHIAAARYFLSIANYHRNDLSAVEKLLVDVVDDLYIPFGFIGIHSCFTLSLASLGLGHTQKARVVAEAATAFAEEIQYAYMATVTRAFEAEVAVRQGRLDDALDWARGFDPEPLRPLAWVYVPQLTLVKVMLARNTTRSRQEAAALLTRLQDFVMSTHNTRFRIDVLALRALLHDAEGDDKTAFKKLTESLALAEPGGFIRAFVDLGPPMADLLHRLPKQNVATDYVDQLLAAFPSPDRQSPGFPVSPSSSSRIPQPLVEPLTTRELDVLELLAQRFRNKEIAEKLVISSETVKGHLKNLYQKLNADGRREAVAKATALGIFTPR